MEGQVPECVLFNVGFAAQHAHWRASQGTTPALVKFGSPAIVDSTAPVVARGTVPAQQVCSLTSYCNKRQAAPGVMGSEVIRCVGLIRPTLCTCASLLSTGAGCSEETGIDDGSLDLAVMEVAKIGMVDLGHNSTCMSLSLRKGFGPVCSDSTSAGRGYLACADSCCCCEREPPSGDVAESVITCAVLITHISYKRGNHWMAWISRLFATTFEVESKPCADSATARCDYKSIDRATLESWEWCSITSRSSRMNVPNVREDAARVGGGYCRCSGEPYTGTSLNHSSAMRSREPSPTPASLVLGGHRVTDSLWRLKGGRLSCPDALFTLGNVRRVGMYCG